jgi:hypothetical protein
MSKECSTGEVRTSSGNVKVVGTGQPGIVRGVSYSDTAAGIVLLRDGGSGGTIKAVLRLGAAGMTYEALPNVAFGTDIYVDMSTVTSPHVVVYYEQ